MIQKRIYSLDLAKFLVAFLVVFCHVYGIKKNVSTFIYAFHMPFFFLISGIFYKYTGKINFTKHTKSLITPAFFYILLNLLVIIALDNENESISEILNRELTKSILGFRHSGVITNSICWFTTVPLKWTNRSLK